MRASVDNAATAEAIGINTKALYAGSFALGAGLAAIGGIAGAELLPMESTYAVKYLALFLAVVAVGGHGSVAGSLFAALLLGMVDTATKYLAPSLSSLSFYLTMFIVLVVWPNGLFRKGGNAR
jgi:branched-chain amino acid transport system permease protein